MAVDCLQSIAGVDRCFYPKHFLRHREGVELLSAHSHRLVFTLCTLSQACFHFIATVIVLRSYAAERA